MNHQVHASPKVVEDHDLAGGKQQDVGGFERVGYRAGTQMRLDIRDRAVSEIADQPPGEPGFAVQVGRRIKRLELADLVQRVVAGELRDAGIVDDADSVTPNLEAATAGETDDRVAAPFFTAFDGFEKIGPGLVRQLEVSAQRCVEIGQKLPDERYAVVSLLTKRLKLCLV